MKGSSYIEKVRCTFVACMSALAVILPRAGEAVAVSEISGIENTQFKNVIATGADEVFLDNNELVVIYSKATTSASLTLPGYAEAQLLLVGGGGAGANPGAAGSNFGSAGGGGAGGMLEVASKFFAVGEYAITVGAGGVSPSAQGKGGNGGSSIIAFAGATLYEALGGGGGGFRSVGENGGSGGGGSSDYASSKVSAKAGGSAVQPGSTYGGFGYAGGIGNQKRVAAGGGGAGGAGGNTVKGASDADNLGGAGGSGCESAITGKAVIYAAGGGGGSRQGKSAALGGSNIGGNGAYASAKAGDGLDGTGSGGGGGSYDHRQGGAGGCGTVIVRIKAVMPEKPKADYGSIEYDGSEKVLYKGSDAIVIKKNGEIVENIAVKDVGTYEFTVSLKSEYWDDGSQGEVTVKVTVIPPSLKIDEIAMEGWQVGEMPFVPVVKTSPFQITPQEYTVLYSTSSSGPWAEAVPVTAGDYFVTISVQDSENYSPPASIPVVAFKVWDWDFPQNPVEGLGYHATITVDKYTGEAVAGFPMLVKLSENSPKGFKYKYAAEDGSDIRFADSAGNILAHEIETWNENGESIIWVRVPEYKQGASVTMWWGQLEGATLPEMPAASAVWDDYAGVWHFAESEGTAYDSTKNKLNGTPKGGRVSEMKAAPGIVGTSRANLVAADGNYTSLQDVRAYISINNYNTLKLGSVFTISGWFKADHIYGYSRIFSRRNASGDNDGWEVELNNNSATSFKFRGAGGTGKDQTVTLPDIRQDWLYITAVYNGTSIKVYANGELKHTGTITAATDNGRPLSFGNDSNGDERSFFGWYDEIRLTGVARGDAWIKADYAQIKNTAYTFGPTQVTPDAVFKNRWIKEPSIEKTTWAEGTMPPKVFAGESAYGTAYYIFKPAVGDTLTNNVLNVAGEAEFIARVDAGKDEGGSRSWGALETPAVFIDITAATPFSDLSGTVGNMTLAGRVLLANDYGDGAGAIRGQGYSLTNPNNGAGSYWVHSGSSPIAARPKLSASTESELFAAAPIDELCATNTIWYLKDISIGSTYVDSLIPSKTENYLPWSTSAKPNGTQEESAHMVMRNIADAAIYSPCYTNGIGTIYFDAVNSHTSDVSDGYELVLEICTNLVTGAGIPTDDRIAATDLATGTMDRFGNAEWVPVEVFALKKDGTDTFSEPIKTSKVTLDIATGGSYNNFYRVYAKIEYPGPVRFRIRRPTKAGTLGANYRFILLDNIIVSYPSMAADLVSAGEFDEKKVGKEILGYEASMVPAFPAVDGEIFARAKAEYTTGEHYAADTSKFITGARMFYRWRYLAQEIGGWNSVALDPANGFKSSEPLNLPEGRVGDVEYYFVSRLNVPFYEYVDYSGANLGLGGYYTEQKSVVTNRLDSLSPLPSQGTDWFVRLREGESDFEAANLVIKGIDTPIKMELTGDHVWRGFYQTLSNKVSEIEYRFEFLNKQIPGSSEFEFNTNRWYSIYNNSPIPVSDILNEGTTNDWTSLKVDATTGYLMFQVDDVTRSITVVHADYQNFNRWSDAKAKGDKFVGSSVKDENKTGTSPLKQEFTETFDSWEVMPAINSDWELFSFSDIQHLEGREAYTPFGSDVDRNWSIGPGMWVSRVYADNKANQGTALQMEGCGKGFVQYTDAADAPRGLKSISFNARLGQYTQFNDFCYYDGEVKTSMTDYTFASRCAFDLNSNKDFSGNASLSLVAYYRPGKGCYEARFEQVGGNWDKNNKLLGPHEKGQRLSLYRWSVLPSGKMVSELLATYSKDTGNNGFAMPKATGISSTGFMPFFISVQTLDSTTTRVTAGFRDQSIGLIPASSQLGTAGNWYGVTFDDKVAAKRHKSGTYGLVSANCPGVFGRLQTFSDVVTVAGDKDGRFTKQPLSFGVALEGYKGLDDDLWVIAPGRMVYVPVDSDDALKHIAAAPSSQKLVVSTADAGKTDWKLLKEIELTSFGNATKPETLNLYTTKDCSVRIAASGAWDDPRTDVVIDSVKLEQWRGDDYDNNEDFCVKPWHDPYDEYEMTNFVFTSAWIKDASVGSQVNRTLLMSAKRVDGNGTDVCSIRSPVMDGYKFTGGKTRGSGLGMISLKYRNAQENAWLQVQVATNNFQRNYLQSYDKLDSALWTTVTNWNFKTDAALKNARSGGILSCYLGLHGVKGLVRVIVAPELVSSSQIQNGTDPAKFGEIEIERIYCCDEPVLDAGCWWGWNLRTVGSSLPADSEKRMFLPDVGDEGLSLALNNSASRDIYPDDEITYRQNKPFLQTPTFTSNVVGEVAFKARKYDAGLSYPSSVVLFGSLTGTADSEWVKLKEFVVSNNTYSAYSYKTDPGQAYAAFRLAVTGAEGVQNAGAVVPSSNPEAARVLIDEVIVSEAIRARVAFRKVGAFRSDMNGTGYVPNVPSRKEQPLCGESWGVQCEIYAAQLADEINFNIAPTVILHWFDGDYPWGYENWKDKSKAEGRNSAVLARATGTNLIYRSSNITAPASVVQMSTRPGSIVQYTLEVRYYQKGSTVPMTNFLNSAEWLRPEWYKPLDLNRDYGRGKSFAAYNILDTVAPGWAWINEINIYGLYNQDWYNSDENCQFVELAAPSGANLEGWSVRMLGASVWSGEIVTNTVGTFGTDELPGIKENAGLFTYSNYVFRVLANRNAQTSGRLKKADGTLDGVWDFSNLSDTFLSSGEIFAVDPIGVQLVRPSGIVEHEVLAMGTNFYGSVAGWEDDYNPTNTVDFLRKALKESGIFFVGSDDGGEANSLGVFDGHGETDALWNKTMKKTPGRPNEKQYIDSDYPTPNGETLVIHANIDNTVGRLEQNIDGVWTNASQMVFIKRGSERGTNILYRAQPWFELGSVTTNGVPLAIGAPIAPREYSVNVGKGISNNVTVIARAQLQRDLTELHGLGPDNRYTPAVVRWLEEGRDINGNRWADPVGGVIRLADYINWDTDAVITNLNLTQMYWLDMDPTVGDLALKGEVYDIAPGVKGSDGSYSPDRVGVRMLITNRVDDAASPYYGQAWTPYVLRGLEPGSNSWNYQGGWTSVTFKVAGVVDSQMLSSRRNWVALRWFVFGPDSFRPATDARPFTTDIDITDPFSTDSPGYTAGWYDWSIRNGGKRTAYYLWNLDDTYLPISVELLKQENFHE